MRSRIMNKREEKIMRLLWNQTESMTIGDIEQAFAEEELNKTTIFKAVQSLEQLGYVRVNGVEQVGRSYARKFESAITLEQYGAIMLQEKGITKEGFAEVAVAMLGAEEGKKGKKNDDKLISELQGMIAKLKKQNK